MEPVDQVTAGEHPYGCSTGILVGKIEIDEGETEEVVLVGWLNLVGHEFERVVVVGRRVIAQTLEGYLLLGHELAGGLVHLSVVDTETAEYGESFENRDVRVGEGDTVVLVDQLGYTYDGALTVNYRHAEDASRRLCAYLLLKSISCSLYIFIVSRIEFIIANEEGRGYYNISSTIISGRYV